MRQQAVQTRPEAPARSVRKLAVVYVRVSTEDQARRGYSLPEQLEACRSRALALGYRAEQVVECADQGVPGDVLHRPGLDRARELVRSGAAGALICMDPDRLSRDLLNQLLVDRELERAGAKLEFVNFSFDRDPLGQAFFGFRGLMSQLEKALIRERTMRGKLGKAKRGGLTHAPGTYGYAFDTVTDTLREDAFPADPHRPELGSRGDLVRLIFAWANAGDGPPSIAARLGDLGIPGPRGGRWHRQTVLRMLRNETYRGRLHLRRYDAAGQRLNPFLPPEERVQRRVRPSEEWIAVSVPPLVEQAVWESVQVRLTGRRPPRGTGAASKYLLAGLLTCGYCGARLRGNLSHNGKGRRYRWYVCSSRSPRIPGKVPCRLPYLRAEELEEAVWAEVKELLVELEARRSCHGEGSLDESPGRTTDSDEDLGPLSAREAVALTLEGADLDRRRALLRALVEELVVREPPHLIIRARLD